ncbi:MAG: hypothetical protein WC839_02900 [Candidatus Paceibacterota bacterium]
MNSFNSSIIGKFMPIWISSQEDLSKVIRWADRLNDGIGKRMIRQTTLKHQHSFALFCSASIICLQPHIEMAFRKKLDANLLKDAVEMHDLGEGLTLKGDIPAPCKTDLDDLNEYLAVEKLYSDMPKIVWNELGYAFLLQFAIKNPSCFPERARILMEKIKKDHYYEALTFQALEKFEYLFYPKWMLKRHPYLLVWVMRGNLKKYREFAEKLPGFRQEIFTPSLEDWMLNFLEENKNVPEDPILLQKVRKEVA